MRTSNKAINLTVILTTSIIIYSIFFHSKIHAQTIISYFLICEFIKFSLYNNFFFNNNLTSAIKERNEDISNLVINIFFFILILIGILMFIFYSIFKISNILIFNIIAIALLGGTMNFFFYYYNNKKQILSQLILNLFISITFLFYKFENQPLLHFYIISLLNIIQIIIIYLIIRNKFKLSINPYLLKDYRTIFFLKKFVRKIITKEKSEIVIILLLIINFLYYFNKT
tara:strand:- start:148 stop:831 length:684 start_codon:yes stop_codon:yes gene_type:complete